MSKRRRYSRQQQQAQRQPQQQQPQPRTQGALALADNGSTPATPANVVRTFTPAPMAGNAQYNVQGNQQWGPTSNTAGEAPSNKYYPDMPTVRDDQPLLTNIGATGTAIFTGVVTNEEYNPDFYWRDGIKIFEQMLRNDGQVNAVREIVEQPILRAEKHIIPGSSSARDQEIASFVETCLFEDMRYTSTDGIEEVQTWDSLLRHILMHLWYGFMVFEQVWRIEDGWVKWARWTPLLPRTIWRWWVGNDNALVGIQQWTFREHTYQFVDIPARKLVRFHRRLEGQNYEGVSVLRSAYKHWFYKVQFEKIEAIGSERNAVVPAVITLPEGFTQGDSTQAQTIVANIRANSQMGVVLPPGWTIEYMRNFQRQAVQLQDSIQYHDVMIARNSLAQFINLGSTETGAYSLDDSQRKDFLSNLQSICCAIEDTINNGPIRQLVDYNYDGVEVYPKLQFGKVLMSDLSQLSDALSKLATAGFIHPDPGLEDYVREAGGLPGAPKSVIAAYNPTAPSTPSRPENANASSHDTQQPTQATPQGASDTANSTGPDDGGSDGGGSLSEVRMLAEALQATVQAIDPVERGTRFFFGGHEPGYQQNRDAKGHWAPGEGGSGEHEGSGGGRGRGGSGGSEHEGAAKSAGSGRSRSGGAGGSSGSKGSKTAKAEKPAKEPKAKSGGSRKKEEFAPIDTHQGRINDSRDAIRNTRAEIERISKPSYGMPEHLRAEAVARLQGNIRQHEERIARIEAEMKSGTNAPKEPNATKTTRATKAAKSPEERAAAKTARSGKSEDEETTQLRAEAKALKRSGGHGNANDRPVIEGQKLRLQHDTTDPVEALRNEHGDHHALFEQLTKEPLGSLESMAHRDALGGAKVPRGADRYELARHIAVHMAPEGQRASLEKDLLKREIELRTANRSANEQAKSSRSSRSTKTTKGERTLEQHTHDELKAMAKEQGVKAGKTKAETIANIRAKGEGKAATAKSGGKQKAELLPMPKPIQTPGLTKKTPLHILDPYDLRDTYGRNQLRNVLRHADQEGLRQAVRLVKEQHPGTKPAGRTNEHLIDYIVKHVAGDTSE